MGNNRCIFEPIGQDFVAKVQDPVTRVIIVGAGFSGIAAANSLQTCGVEVVVLEGRSQIGGRTRTVPTLGASVEAGGAWIHTPVGNPLTDLANFLSIEQRRFALSDIFSNMRLVGLDGEVLDTLERDRVMQLADEIETELTQLAPKYTPTHTVAELLEFRLLAITDASLQAWVRFVVYTGFQADLACHAEDISIANYALDAGFSGGDNSIVGGYSKMLSRLADGLEIYCDSLVSEVQQTTEGVTVRCIDGRVERGSHVVISVPLGVLKAGGIRFLPDLPVAKKRAIEQLGFGAFEKLILQFEQAFWKSGSACPSGVLIRDHPIFPYWIDVTSRAGLPTLVAHIAGPPALALAELSPDAALAMALSALATAFACEIPKPTAVHQTNWSGDPCSRGAYTHLSPVSTIQDLQFLGEPEGRVLFAGEATSMQRFGYVDGAYISGLREAQRLVSAPRVRLSAINCDPSGEIAP
ncbi:NAD(P)/FAD-dependent oxidoreductase [Massilia sp. YIM B04103]|uniref:flavin monoamine oxidase family protein n=1 Tax=Massilia sp. YIM B04103 TaxID=2963106 RepID=UPI0021094830|nr:NAD(P)/FAD-dependent oxidoreductase [Massilia sp. YIM B04103]